MHVSLDWDRGNSTKLFHLDGAVSVSVTTPIESLGENFVLMLERQYPAKGTADNQNFQTQLIPCASPLTLEVTLIF